jgi:hypothetical protein
MQPNVSIQLKTCVDTYGYRVGSCGVICWVNPPNVFLIVASHFEFGQCTIANRYLLVSSAEFIRIQNHWRLILMAISNIYIAQEHQAEQASAVVSPITTQTQASAVSWAAIFAGALAIAALALILLMLGLGLGLSSVSPWAYSGVSATTFGVSTILWLTFTQLVASGAGGYLSGRLRTRWLSVHTDEIYFRDTVHGFLAWAFAALITATVLTSITGAIINGGLQASASVAGGAGMVAAKMAKPEAENGPISYFVDSLFRKSSYADSVTTTAPPIDMHELGFRHAEALEVTRIFTNSLHNGALPAEDIRYVGQMVAQRTNLNQQEAEKRVVEIYSKVQTKLHDAEVVAKDAADKARKTFAYATLWMFIALLIGAFVASLAATIGGRQRDL